MQGGHNKKSDDLHWLQGTKPEPPPAAKEGTPIPPGRPKYPAGISAAAKRVFKRLCSLLEERKHLSHGDGELLRLYALLYTRHEKAMAKLETEGEICTYIRLDSNGQPHDQVKPNLWLKVAQDSERNMVACLDRLGLTPGTRARVKPTGVVANPEPVKEVSPEEQFVNAIGKPVQAAPTLDDFEDIDTENLQ